jgi:hypothetical protein
VYEYHHFPDHSNRTMVATKESQKFPTTSVEFFESDKITFKRFSTA